MTSNLTKFSQEIKNLTDDNPYTSSISQDNESQEFVEIIRVSPRKWGIDVIAAIYGLLALLLIWRDFNTRTSGLIVALMLAMLSIGFALRINTARTAMMIALGISLVVDGIFFLFYLGAFASVFHSPPDLEPLERLKRLAIRVALTVTIFIYLKRSDVRNAFQLSPRSERAEKAQNITAYSNEPVVRTENHTSSTLRVVLIISFGSLYVWTGLLVLLLVYLPIRYSGLSDEIAGRASDWPHQLFHVLLPVTYIFLVLSLVVFFMNYLWKHHKSVPKIESTAT